MATATTETDQKIRNPERLAWIILWTAFITFCILAVSIPLGTRWYLINATQVQPVSITSVRGAVLIGEPTAELTSSLADGNSTTIQEAVEIATDSTSQAILTFFDDSTLTMYSSTRIVLHRSRIPRFSISSKPAFILVEVKQGRVRATSARSRDTLQFDLQTPHAYIELGRGSFSIETSEELTQVVARLGQAQVTAQGHTITLQPEERSVVLKDTPPSLPLPSARNLLKTSGFTPESLAESWETYTIAPIEGVTATVRVEDFAGRPVLRFKSEGQDNVHTEVGVIQQVEKDVRDFQSLRVFADVRLVYQSLPGGGQLGSEFPIMLHVAYKDTNGNDRDWFHGFYYAPPPENYILYDQPDNSSERIARFIWYPYESVNLLTALGPAKPVYIKSIRIYASGWIYDAMVGNISLLAQE